LVVGLSDYPIECRVFWGFFSGSVNAS